MDEVLNSGRATLPYGADGNTIPNVDAIKSWVRQLETAIPMDEGDSDEEEAIERDLRAREPLELRDAKKKAGLNKRKRVDPAPRVKRPNPEPLGDEGDAKEGSPEWFEEDDNAPAPDNTEESDEQDVLQLPANLVRRDLLLHVVGIYEEDRKANHQHEVSLRLITIIQLPNELSRWMVLSAGAVPCAKNTYITLPLARRNMTTSPTCVVTSKYSSICTCLSLTSTQGSAAR